MRPISEPLDNYSVNNLYAVVGNPIAHSKSPLIHRLFAEQTGQQIGYEAIRINPDEKPFNAAIQQLIAKGYQGINITVPFKLEAFQFADQLSERAQVAEAVNTFVFKNDGQGTTTFGDNTDGIGLVNDIQQNGHCPLQGKRILVLGAGGAVQGILAPLLENAPAHLHLANRTPSKAEALAKHIAPFAKQCTITTSDWQTLDIPTSGFDVIINGTSASLQQAQLPISPDCIGKNSLVYDMMYGAQPTLFLNWAKQQQPTCQTRDGLGMLVEQAAEAFYLWRGIKPQTAPVIQAVRQMLAGQ